ncbi:hypothetical protein BHYA_0015g00080 [Botrytis hyacinthi]|uniref:Uncharacterized protein n=1 Tax=Botrytis hyacinthi TaxID=278943 RepID=A0A4Z1GZ68_9HELO|nr:hypothetical protein BHYA_0015g00080 [Botrytis hyacinthi]
MNFGVLEIAPSKYVPAPGYAYVPDVSNTPQIGLQPSARRARGPAGAGLGAETTKKQDAKILRELAQLDRENHRDVNIPVTGGGRGKEGGRGNQSKLTPSVRKILASQKTFANHLSDFEALSSLPTSTPTTQQPAPPTLSTPKYRQAQPQEKRTAPPRHRTPQAQPQKKRSQRPGDFDSLTHYEHTDDQIRSGNYGFRTHDDFDADRSNIRAVFVLAAAPETAPERSRSVACFARADFAESAGDAEVVGGAAAELY